MPQLSLLRPVQHNNAPMLSDISPPAQPRILHNNPYRRMVRGMKTHILIPALTALALLAGPASAECYADYKAKRDNPLRLQYGVAELPAGACDASGAAAHLAPRLARDGWTLLQIMSVFGPEGLEERRESAGQYYLRY